MRPRFVKLLIALNCLAAQALWAAGFQPTDLRCEYLRDPLGIDTAQPRLSWVGHATAGAPRGQRQSAYQILVASSLKRLKADQGDLWDSGQISSDQSIQVRYHGQSLSSEQDCYWKVRTWDQAGKPSRWSEPAHWSMGLLRQEDWRAQWIGLDEVETSSRLTGTWWIWFPEGHAEASAPVGTRYFRKFIDLPAGRIIKSAHWLVAADNEFSGYVNGKMMGTGGNFKSATDLDVREQLRPGKNLLAASVRNAGEGPNPAGFTGLLEIEFNEGPALRIATDESWRSTTKEFEGWEKAAYDDSTWLAARKLGAVGMAPWGEVSGPENRRLAARWLRKPVEIGKNVRRATAYFAGLGLSEFYLNGQKIGDEVLSPGLTEYAARVFYVTRDVTSQLKRGANVVGVVLGNGRYYSPRGKVPTDTRGFGFPKLRFQMKVEYEDGSTTTLLSDASWRLTDQGPIRANNEYDGEDYDARMELPGWSAPGYDDSAWRSAQLVPAPVGAMAAQMMEPIRVTETLQPISVSEPRPGVFIFDLGQNMVGWCRLRVAGPAGTIVQLRHAETLQPDGTLYLDNIRSAKVTDRYVLKGKGREVYEPRFTYHGFRYVEVTGYPGKPTLSTLDGRLVHDDLETAGDFNCSNPLLNRIYRCVRWGVRDNYRSIPTDCPQRDERQGWLGDRSAECRGETYLFNTAALYSKWVRDMSDSQKESGSVSDVCPAYWPIYSDNVTWPSSLVIIPGTLQDQFADETVARERYESVKKWMDFMSLFVTNGVIARDSYGDWCVPPEDPKLIHSNDPKRKTEPSLLATAYFYYDARLVAQYARRLGKAEDAQNFDQLAETLKAGFNRRFWKEDLGQYDNGTQTSCVLPLAFGLAPEAARERLIQHLLKKIHEESQDHIGTGLIGGQWLMRVLSDNGYPEVAYRIASQKSYPSWGFMLEHGATTIWELWNGNTADPAMNSGNHVMLVGDFIIWLNECLAGIKPDPAQPGFKHLVMRPQPVGDLTSAQATHRSPHGWISSGWSRAGGKFDWDVIVPVNTTATLHVPASSFDSVIESGKPAAQARGVKFLKFENGRAIFEVGSGHYRFVSR